MFEIGTKFKVLLCLLVVGESTSITVRHAHELGEAVHLHGFGFWNSRKSGCADAARVGNDSCLCSAPSHSHHVFLGMELFIPSSDPNSTDSSSSQESSLGNPSVSIRTDLRQDLGECDSLPVLESSVDILADVGDRSHRFFHSAISSRRNHLCAQARGERSGVNLT